MLDLRDFSKLYAKSTPLEEEVFDVRFDEIETFVEHENFEGALPLIESIFNEGCLDIRLVMYRLFAEFAKSGPTSFTTVFSFIVTLLDDHWDKISPIKLREKYTFNSLVWLFSTLCKKLKRSSELKKSERPDALWKLSQKTLNLETIDTIEEELSRLSSLFSNRWEQTAIHEHILYIKKWLIPFKIISSPPAEEETLPEPKTETPLAPANDPLISKPMELLIKKLQTFSSLIENDEMTKAALLSDDIRTTLETFNPTLFFPKLFAPYLSLVAKHIDPLLSEWKQKESPQWKSLKELYDTDLDEFLQW